MFCRQTSEFRQPLKQTVAPKVSCLYVFHQRFPLIFRSSQLSGVFLAQKQHTCLPKVFLTSKTSCKEYFVERKQIKSATAAYSKLRMFGGKTCHVCTQLEHMVFPHVYMHRCNGRYVSLSYKIIEFLPHPITLLLVICFKPPITRTFFDFS